VLVLLTITFIETVTLFNYERETRLDTCYYLYPISCSKLFPAKVINTTHNMLPPYQASYYMPPGNQTYHSPNPNLFFTGSLITQPYYLHLALTTIALTPPIAVIPQSKHSTCISGTTISPILRPTTTPHYKPKKPPIPNHLFAGATICEKSTTNPH